LGELFTSYENEEKQKYKQVTYFEPCKIQIGCWKKQTTVKFDKHVIDELRAFVTLQQCQHTLRKCKLYLKPLRWKNIYEQKIENLILAI
jgi:hypothetical protein